MVYGPYSTELVVVTPAITYGPYSELVVITPLSETSASPTATIPPGRATALRRYVGTVNNGVVTPIPPGPVPDPIDPGLLEQFVLHGLALNDPGVYFLEDLVIGLPAKAPDWVTGADGDGARLGRDPLFSTRTVNLRVRVAQRSTMSAALDAIGHISDRLEEAERRTNGVNARWSPAGSNRSVKLHVLTGEIKNLPISVEGADAGWFLRSPVLDIELTCAPFLYGTEFNAGTVAGPSRLLTMDLRGVPGDVPAEGRLVLTDPSGNARRHVEWGLEQRWYQPGVSPSLHIAASELTTTGYTGGYDTLLRQVVAGLSKQTAALCGITGRADVGTFRVKVSVRNTKPGAQFRLAWQEGSGQFRTNQFVTAPAGTANDFHELDLGLVTIPQADTGSQRWVGRIEGRKTTATGVPSVFLRHVLLIPAGEAYGVVRATQADTTAAGTLTVFDSFDGMTGYITNREAESGGRYWSTTGDQFDFPAYVGDQPDAGILHNTGGTRVAFLPGTTLTDSEVSVRVLRNTPTPDATVTAGPVARFLDATNYVRLEVVPNSRGTDTTRIVQRVGGADTTLAQGALYAPGGAWVDTTLRVYASGRVVAVASVHGRTVTLKAYSAALATGGALASGVVGLRANGGMILNEFAAGIPISEPLAIPASRSLEIRHDAALVEALPGVYGTSGEYRGARFYVPPSGSEVRTTRVAVKARRDDVTVDADNGTTDQLTATVYLTPRYIAVPR